MSVSRVVAQEAVSVIILGGPHVCPTSARNLQTLMQRLFTQAKVQLVEDKKLSIPQGKALLILPAASDIDHWAIPAAVQDDIRRKNAQGLLKVIGVCAGAFFASKQIVYDGQFLLHRNKNTTLFSGTCEGPAFNRSNDLIHAEPIIIKGLDATIDVAMRGGGAFIPDDSLQEGADYEVLGRYDSLPSKPIAMIACNPMACNPGEQPKEFNTVLMGPHIEYAIGSELDDMAKIFQHAGENHKADSIRAASQQLNAHKTERIGVMRYVLSKLGF